MNKFQDPAFKTYKDSEHIEKFVTNIYSSTKIMFMFAGGIDWKSFCIWKSFWKKSPA